MRGMRARLAVGLTAVAAATLASACSGGATADGTPVTTGPTTTNPPATHPPADRTATDPPGTTAAPATTVPEPATLVEAQVGVGPTSFELARPIDPAELDDPFGTYAACSGLDATVGTWALQISDPLAEMTAVGILTVPRVTGPGEYEATFRLEWANAAALDATGSVRLDPGLQSGTFAANDFDIHGSFRCTGAPRPEPLGETAAEVYALLQRGPEQRIVSLAAPTETAATCPTAVAGPVELRGPARAGSISRFAVGASAASLAIRVGDTELALDPGTTVTDLGLGSGTFHAETVDGTVIDGAYRCH
jgi:hypothetical protein